MIEKEIIENNTNVISEEPQKSRKPLFFIVVGLVIISLIGGGLLIFKGKKATTKINSETTLDTNLPPADPNIKVDLKPINDGKVVILSISNIPSETVSVEYELTYLNDKGLPKGVLGTIRLTEGNQSIEREITLGTCSSGRCVYDENVEKVTVTLKFNTTSGASRFQKEFPLR